MAHGARSISRRTLWLTSAALGAMLACPATAQVAQAPVDQETQADGTKTKGEDIVVTGSRIARPETDRLQPTVVTPAQKIDDSGYINLGNVIRQSPLFQAYDASTGDRAGKGQTQGDAGTTFANLYNLGSQRTLTLIDGKRVVGAASPNGAGANGLQVDISSIPTGLVDRIETVSIGGAPIYGSDAIAGTVNVILKQNFQGVDVDLQTGATFRNADGQNYRAQIMAGQNFAGGRGNITLAASYTQQKRISAEDRDFNLPFGLVNPPSGAAALIPVYNGGYVFASGYGRPSTYFGISGVNTSGQPAGFYTSGGQPLTFDRTGNLVPFSAVGAGANFGFAALPGAPTAQLVATLPSSDTDTTRQYNDVISPSRRVFLFGNAHYDVTDRITLWARGSYSETHAQFAPAAPSQLALNGDPAGYSILINPATNPFLNPSARSFLLANPGPFGSSFYLNREFTDLAGDLVRSDQQSYNVQAGAKGTFNALAGSFHWDLTGSFGETKRTTHTPSLLASRLLLAEDAVYANGGLTAVLATPANLSLANFTYDNAAHLYRETGTGNVITCRARVAGMAPARASATDVSGCAPLNPFGAQNPQDAASYVQYDAQTFATIKQRYVEGNVGGNVFKLPAGPVAANVGFQVRREEASFNLNAGLTTPYSTGSNYSVLLNSSIGAPVSGGYTTKEVYGEVRVPVLNREMTGFIEDLTLEGAVRYMSNSLAGDDVTWTAGGRLTVVPGVTFRGNKTRSARQPAVGELFAGTLPVRSSVTDPCDRTFIDIGPNPTQRRNSCVALAIASGAATSATATTFLSTYTAALGAVNGTASGNPNLQSEIADSWTAGIVLAPRFLPRFTLSGDYISIRIKGAISSLNGSGVAAACTDSAAGPTNFYCSAITRGNTFRITGFSSFQANTDLIDYAAVTVQGRYGPIPLSSSASLTFDGTLLYTEHYRTGLNNNVTELVGNVGSERVRGSLGANLAVGPVSAYLNETYYAPSQLDRTNPTLYQFNRVPAYYLTDLAVNLRIAKQLKLQVTVNNLLDVSPPFNTFSYQFDRIGRRFTVGANFRF